MSNQKTSVDLARARRRSERGAGASTGVVDLHRQLLDIAFDLSVEFDTLPAGSVLRCFARAAHRARMAGCADDDLSEVARAAVVRTLAERVPVRDGTFPVQRARSA